MPKTSATVIKEYGNVKQGNKGHVSLLPFVFLYLRVNAFDAMSEVQRMPARMPPKLAKCSSIALRAIQDIMDNTLIAATKYLVHPSAMAFYSCVEKYILPGIAQYTESTFLEFQEPHRSPFSADRPVKALYWTMDYPTDSMERSVAKYLHQMPDILALVRDTYKGREHLYTLFVIDEEGRDVFQYSYALPFQTWVFPEMHPCPYKQCTYPRAADPTTGDLGECLPCHGCREALIYWEHMFCGMMSIFAREFAQEPYPPDWSVEEQCVTNPVRVLVGHRSKRIVTKNIERTLTYRIVTFDVARRTATRVTPVPSATQQDARSNWLTQHAPEEWLWRKVAFKGLTRVYRPPRYQRLLERVKKGTLSEGTQQFALTQDRDGNEAVIGTVAPFDRWVPFLDPEKRAVAMTVKKQ